MAGVRHAAYTGTRNIYGDMEACAKSLVSNSAVDVVHFLIEDVEFPHELPDIVQCHDVSGQTLFPQGGPNMTSRFSYMALMRVALCYVIPDARRVLSLDCDTFCRRDVTAIWELPVDGYEMPTWFNSNHWTDKGVDKNPAIIHYAGKKRDEWIREPDAEFWRKVTWDEAMARHAEIVREHSCASS